MDDGTGASDNENTDNNDDADLNQDDIVVDASGVEFGDFTAEQLALLASVGITLDGDNDNISVAASLIADLSDADLEFLKSLNITVINDIDDDSNTGNNGNGNAGNNGNDNNNNSNGNSGDDDSDNDSDSDDNGNSGNNGNGNSGNSDNGNSGNNGNGNNSSQLTLATADSATNEDFGINWGKWDRSIDANWGIVTRVNDALTIVSTSKYFAEVNPTPVANLKGIASYGSGLVSSFIGNGSAGEISSLLAAMDVNFDTGSITNGSLLVNVADQAWAIDFVGSVNGGVVGLGATAAQLRDSTGLISTSINANLGGLFTGNAAETFVGGFDLQDLINPLNSVEGIYTINR